MQYKPVVFCGSSGGVVEAERNSMQRSFKVSVCLMYSITGTRYLTRKYEQDSDLQYARFKGSVRLVSDLCYACHTSGMFTYRQLPGRQVQHEYLPCL